MFLGTTEQRCRACLNTKTVDKLIDWSLPLELYDITYAQCYCECTRLEVNAPVYEVEDDDNDEKSEQDLYEEAYLCYDCVDQLESAYGFLLTCRKSDEVLRNEKLLAEKAPADPVPASEPVKSDMPHFNEEESEILLEEITFEEAAQAAKNTKVIDDDEVSVLDYTELPPDKPKRQQKVKLHTCNVCGHIFKRPSHLRNHLESHKDNRERNFSCNQCDKKFMTQVTLDNHMELHAPDRQATHECELCGKKFLAKGNLTIHLRLHAAHREYVCSICGKGYVRRVELNVHMKRTHSGVKHKCELCGKEYVQEPSYKAHMKTHEGHAYKCDLCDRYYATRHTYLTHQLTHSQMPFKCAFCDKAYVRRDKLRNHIQTLHMIDEEAEIDKHCIALPRERRPYGWKVEMTKLE